MYAEAIRQFSAHCCAKLWAGEPLTDDECDAWATLLAARELQGHRWLGELASPDGSFDTVSGRCGLAPVRLPPWQRCEVSPFGRPDDAERASSSRIDAIQ